MTIVLAHGAGSTGDAARALLGMQDRADVVALEDRTGDVDVVVEAIESAVATHPDCVEVIGISLGAHAAARWASRRVADVRLTLVLPAWTGAPTSAAQATAASSEEIGRRGISGNLSLLEAQHPGDDVVRLLRHSWPSYDDEQLRMCLLRASRGEGPTPVELERITAPVRIVGWYADAFHPHQTGIAWSRHTRTARIATAARPRIDLLQDALASIRWPA